MSSNEFNVYSSNLSTRTNGVVSYLANPYTISAGSTYTLTIANILNNKIIYFTDASACTIMTDSSSNIFTGLSVLQPYVSSIVPTAANRFVTPPPAGCTVDFFLVNNGGGTITLEGGSGVTLFMNSTSVAAGVGRVFKVNIGNNAVSVYG